MGSRRPCEPHAGHFAGRPRLAASLPARAGGGHRETGRTRRSPGSAHFESAGASADTGLGQSVVVIVLDEFAFHASRPSWMANAAITKPATGSSQAAPAGEKAPTSLTSCRVVRVPCRIRVGQTLVWHVCPGSQRLL